MPEPLFEDESIDEETKNVTDSFIDALTLENIARGSGRVAAAFEQEAVESAQQILDFFPEKETLEQAFRQGRQFQTGVPIQRADPIEIEQASRAAENINRLAKSGQPVTAEAVRAVLIDAKQKSETPTFTVRGQEGFEDVIQNVPAVVPTKEQAQLGGTFTKSNKPIAEFLPREIRDQRREDDVSGREFGQLATREALERDGNLLQIAKTIPDVGRVVDVDKAEQLAFDKAAGEIQTLLDNGEIEEAQEVINTLGAEGIDASSLKSTLDRAKAEQEDDGVGLGTVMTLLGAGIMFTPKGRIVKLTGRAGGLLRSLASRAVPKGSLASRARAAVRTSAAARASKPLNRAINVLNKERLSDADRIAQIRTAIGRQSASRKKKLKEQLIGLTNNADEKALIEKALGE